MSLTNYTAEDSLLFLQNTTVLTFSSSYPGDVGDHLEGDPTARYGAASGHPSEKVVGKTLAAWVYIDADPLSQDQLHVCRVAELNHHSNCQVYPLLWPRSSTTELGTLMDGRVP